MLRASFPLEHLVQTNRFHRNRRLAPLFHRFQRGRVLLFRFCQRVCYLQSIFTKMNFSYVYENVNEVLPPNVIYIL